MPNACAVFRRVRTRIRWVAVLVTLTAGVVATPVTASAEPPPRPLFKSPFACGQVWFARTYVGHPRYAVDWNLPGSGEADFGQAVLAGARGIATVKREAGYGNLVVVDHGGGWQTLYAHLSSIAVTTGQPVAANTVVGRVGRTGRSDGSHLHQEQLLNGVRQQVQLDGIVILPSLSSRGASYQSANCGSPERVRKLTPWRQCRGTAALRQARVCTH